VTAGVFLKKMAQGRFRFHEPRPFHRQAQAFYSAETLVRAFYACLLFFAANGMGSWEGIANRGAFDLLWPVAWLGWTNPQMGASLIFAFYLVSMLAAAFAPRLRWARFAAFFGLFQYQALHYSNGKIGHSMHAWLLISFLLIFLPNAWGGSQPLNRRERQSFLQVFWTCQAFFLLTYSMAGLGKVAGAIYQASIGEITCFHPQAFALHAAERLLETHSSSAFGGWFIEHSLAGWPLMIGGVYLQFFSLLALFRPPLLRLWALGLALFHLLSFFVLTINFPSSVLLLALFLFASPFLSRNYSSREILETLPLFGPVFRRLLSRCAAS
jgi:hypothetical protein